MTNAAIQYLRLIEWQMGNGQCPECGGHIPGEWAPHPCVPTEADEGHAQGCELAAALTAAGAVPVYATSERGKARLVGPNRRNLRRVTQ